MIVVVLINVKKLFWGRNSAPRRLIGTRTGENEPYKPPGAFKTVQGLQKPQGNQNLELLTSKTPPKISTTVKL